LDTMPRAYFIRGRQAISPNQFLGARVPYEQVKVVRIKPVDIERLARAFTGSPESDLAKTAQFVEHIRNMDGSGQVDFQVARSAQQRAGRQTCDLGSNVGWW